MILNDKISPSFWEDGVSRYEENENGDVICYGPYCALNLTVREFNPPFTNEKLEEFRQRVKLTKLYDELYEIFLTTPQIKTVGGLIGC